MTPKDEMERFARRVPGGGIAWENALFSRRNAAQATQLLDAAVDIAWERLRSQALDPGRRLAINTQGRLLIFRLEGALRQQELPVAA